MGGTRNYSRFHSSLISAFLRGPHCLHSLLQMKTSVFKMLTFLLIEVIPRVTRGIEKSCKNIKQAGRQTDFKGTSKMV